MTRKEEMKGIQKRGGQRAFTVDRHLHMNQKGRQEKEVFVLF